MPYISDKMRNRERDDMSIDNILAMLEDHISIFNEDQLEGVLNYTISRILSGAYNMKEPRYYKINRIMGVLECVKQEFYRRIAANYEDQAILNNGDIPEYKESGV